MPHLAEGQPEVFNAYQQVQSKRLERSFKASRYLGSLLGTQSASAVFVGMYEIGECRDLPLSEFWNLPGYGRLKELGLVGVPADSAIELFHAGLTVTPLLAEYKGRLVIGWPPPGISWCRHAARGTFPIRAILSRGTRSVVDRSARRIRFQV